MPRETKFKTGVSGCPEKQFKPGNPHRWQPGQSGNPSRIPRNRLKFEQAFYAALLGQGSAEEAAALLWEPARAHEPWAVQALLQRLVPPTQQIKLTHEVENEQTIDYTRLTGEEIEQLERLLERATTSVVAVEGGESSSQPEGVRDPGMADSRTAD